MFFYWKLNDIKLINAKDQTLSSVHVFFVITQLFDGLFAASVRNGDICRASRCSFFPVHYETKANLYKIIAVKRKFTYFT